jgi:hypothetical protein
LLRFPLSTGKLTPVSLHKLTAAIPILFILSATALNSCYNYREREEIPYTPMGDIEREEAYVPVYGVDTVIRGINSLAPRPTVSAGKIYVYGSYLFQVEKFRGIHVIDYSDKKNPVKIGFITSEGCSELAVKNGFLITNNLDDLVTIDMNKKDNVKEVGRIRKAFPHYHYELYSSPRVMPPEKGKYYVCPDYTQGDVVGWKLEKKVKFANCYVNP